MAQQEITESSDNKIINKVLPPEYFTAQHLLSEIVLKQLEADGMAKVQDITNNKGTMTDVVNILQDGTAAFEKAMGRPMTYSEIRAAYG